MLMVHVTYSVYDFAKDKKTFFKSMLYSSSAKSKDIILINLNSMKVNL